MRLRRRKVTIEINHLKLLVERQISESGEDLPSKSVASGLAHFPPECRPFADDVGQTQLPPPEEIA